MTERFMKNSTTNQPVKAYRVSTKFTDVIFDDLTYSGERSTLDGAENLLIQYADIHGFEYIDEGIINEMIADNIENNEYKPGSYSWFVGEGLYMDYILVWKHGDKSLNYRGCKITIEEIK
jgi:hypothetical protein